MANPIFKRDSKGISELLNDPSMFAADVHTHAQLIATNAQAQWPEADIVVDDYTTSGMKADRLASSVTIREPDALIREAKDGILIRAAAGLGLEVKARAIE